MNNIKREIPNKFNNYYFNKMCHNHLISKYEEKEDLSNEAEYLFQHLTNKFKRKPTFNEYSKSVRRIINHAKESKINREIH